MSNKRTDFRRLPVGLTEFETLITDLITEYGDEMPTKDVESIKFAVSSSIMHLGPMDHSTNLEFFYHGLVAGASKQIAHAVFQQIKIDQKARYEAEKAAEATKTEVNETKN